MDQFAAEVKKQNTRYKSLVLSTDGGVGFKSRTSTLSYDLQGNAVPSEHKHREIFERYFSINGQGTSAERKKSLAQEKKVVDLLIDDSKRLNRFLGQNDKHKLDEYLTSLNTIEEQIQRNEAWLNIPLKSFNADHLNLAVDLKADPEAYIRTTLDLIVLAFQLDLTEVATYLIAREGGDGLGEAFPKLALGIKKGHHRISHDKAKGHWAEWGRYDQWLTSHLAYFINRLKETEDEYGNLLDNTQILYGSACSTTHNARNCPLILAGGKNMGLKHGSYTQFNEKIPLSNLFVKMLNSAGVPTHKFADSTSDMAAMKSIFSA